MKIKSLFGSPMKSVKKAVLAGSLFASFVLSGCDNFLVSICNPHPEYLGCSGDSKVVETTVSLASPTFHLQIQYPANGFSVMDQQSQLDGTTFTFVQTLATGASYTSPKYSLSQFPKVGLSPNKYEYTITITGEDAKKLSAGDASIHLSVPVSGMITLPIKFAP